MADIFDEVSEDLRKDQYKQIWLKYKKIIISLVSIFVLSVIAFKYIQHYQEKKKIEVATLYFNGLNEIKNKNYDKAEDIFKEIIKSADLGYTVLSHFKLASIYLNKKDFQSMESNYNKIINLDKINKSYKEYALFLKITNSPNINNDKKIALLKPILTSPGEFQPIASELEILYLIENKKFENAKNKLEKLSKQKNISNNQKNRLNTINEIYFK
tara:strand:- start:700 stop:1341 length:642 start_codon:yes stop_codon:yes gene_type:complete